MVQHSVREGMNILSIGLHQTASFGTVGNFVTVTPILGEKEIKQAIIFATAAAYNASLVISADTTVNQIFNGYMANRDADNSIRFGAHSTANTNYFVKVGDEGGGSGFVFVLIKHN